MKKSTLGLLFLFGLSAVYYMQRLHAMEPAERVELGTIEERRLPKHIKSQILQRRPIDPVLLRFLQLKIAGKVIQVSNKPYSSIWGNELSYFNHSTHQLVEDNYPILDGDVSTISTSEFENSIFKADTFKNPATIIIFDENTGEEKLRKTGFNDVDVIENKYAVFYCPEDETNPVEVIDLSSGKIILRFENINFIKDQCGCIDSPFEYDGDLFAIQTLKGTIDVYRLSSGEKILSKSFSDPIMNYTPTTDYLFVITRKNEVASVEQYKIPSGEKGLVINNIKIKESEEESESESEHSESEEGSPCALEVEEEIDASATENEKNMAITIVDKESSYVAVYNYPQFEIIFTIPNVHNCEFLTNSLLAVKSNDDERIDVYSIKNKEIILSVENADEIGLLEQQENYVSLFEDDSSIIVVEMNNGDEKFFDLMGRLILTLKSEKGYEYHSSIIGDKLVVEKFLKENDGDRLMHIDIYSLKRGKKIKSFEGENTEFLWHAWCIKVKRADTETDYYNILNGKTITVSHRPHALISPYAIGSNLVIVVYQQEHPVIMPDAVYIYKLQNFESKLEIMARSVNYSYDSELILTHSEDATINIYSAKKDGKNIFTLDNVRQANFALKGKILAALKRDNTVELYLMDSRKKIFSWNGREMNVMHHSLAILQGEGKNQKLFVFDIYKLLRLYKELQAILSQDTHYLLDGFAQAIKDTARMHANEAQWQTFQSLPQNIQNALKLYIQSPLSPQEQRREQQLEALQRRGVTKSKRAE